MLERARWLERLLLRVMRDDTYAHALLGDLEEIYRRKVRSRPVAARVWYMRAAASLLLHYGLRSRGRAAAAPAERKRMSRFDALTRDARYALRWLRRSPGFAAAAILTLGLGIGLNTGIFSVVNAALLRSLPYADADQLMVLTSTVKGEEISVSYPDLQDWRAQSRSFVGLAGFAGATRNFTGDGAAERVRGAAVSPELFEVLRSAPLHGRTLLPADEAARARVVVIGYDLWRRRYAQDPGIVGRSVLIDREPYTVVGIMPAGYGFPAGLVYNAADFWLPLSVQVGAAVTNRDMHPGIVVIGRRRASVSAEQAQIELAGIVERLAIAHPESDRDNGILVANALDALVGGVRGVLFVLLGAVGLILLIACGNVAALLLTRAAARQRELAVRAALGASRGTLLKQLLVESTVLSLLGGLLGLALAYAVTRVAPVLAPEVPRIGESSIDQSVLLFALSATLLNALVFGSIPALHAIGRPLDPWLRQRSAIGQGQHVRSAVVIGEVALSLVLLVCAGVLMKSLAHVLERERGLDPTGVLTFMVQVPQADYAEGEPVAQFYRALEERLAALPGVRSVGAISTLPFSGAGSQSRISRHRDRTIEPVRTDVNAVTPGYFETVGIELVRGRYFTAADRAGARTVGIIDETFAQRLWPGRDPIGQRLEGWGFDEIEVVGVSRHVKSYGVTAESREELYLPHAQRAFFRMNLVVRVAGNPLELVPAARSAVAELDRNVPLAAPQLMTEVVDATVATPRIAAFLTAVFASVSLLLALLGIYGVMAFVVTLRTNEFGVRRALGARTRDLLTAVLTRAIALGMAGIFAGVIVALAASRALHGLVYGVSVRDLGAYMLAPVVMLATIVLAALIPAIRAARVQPVVALHTE